MANISGTAGSEVLTGTAGADSIYGDAGDDIIFGLSGNNTLDGGTGGDVLVAGTGHDTYYVDNASDVITDTGGSDIVFATATYVLSAGIEMLTLSPGAAGIGGTGNASNNVITGNETDNLLAGLGGTDTLVGDDGADTLVGGAGADSLLGGVGDDIYVVDSGSDRVIEIAGQGTDVVQASASFVLSAEVEHLVLTGSAAGGTGNALANIMIGNGRTNSLKGLDGNDTIDGGLGADAMYGGNGNDTFYVDNTSDRVIELAAQGTDTVFSSATYRLGAEIELLTLTGVAHISGTGNALDNVITGNDGNNTLDGGIGSDALIGGAGDDLYVIDNPGDLVVETSGNDTVRSSITIDLANYAGVENVTLTGAVAINATGDAVANILNGSTSTAANILTGDNGNDTYIIGANDTVTDTAGASDTLQVAFTFDLSTNMARVGSTNILVNVSGIENITLLGTGAFNATGDGGSNILTGNRATNSLSGGGGDDTLDGGAGADRMFGGAGNDTFYVDNLTDAVFETTTLGVDMGGTDIVNSTVTFSLLKDANLENLTLLGAGNVNGTGNAQVNAITGNAGNNTLDGGAGADIMTGGGGADVYLVDNVNDQVASGEGTIISSVDYDMSANATTVNNLTLVGGALNGTGNALDNTITGNLGVNLLMGGAGNDTYVADALDTVTDSGGASDTVRANFSVNLATSLLITGVENVTLTGTASLNATGDANGNTLTGNSGINTLDGGDGDDTYVIGARDVILADSSGNDTVVSSISYSIAARNDLEHITLAGTANIFATGNAGNNILTGNGGANLLRGEAGTDTLDGKAGNDSLDGGAGADTMIGRAGNDTYVVEDAGDVVTERTDVNEGIDTVRSSITYSLAGTDLDLVENLTLTGAAADGTGNAIANVIIGTAANNTLDGGDGNDTLMGGAGDDVLIGGGGNDTMNGGAGNDQYFVDSSSDVIIDTGGLDSVSSSASYLLATGVEFLSLTGVDDINGVGNLLANVITGNDGDNFLSGLEGNDVLVGDDGADILNGGVGVDTMYGGLGDDTFYIDNLLDQFVENSGEGDADLLVSIFSVAVLPGNIENLTLSNYIPPGGTAVASLYGIGDGGANVITGNSASNSLDGGGGNDTLVGLAGDDRLVAGTGNDTLSGGSGADSMTGGAGADHFVFELATAFSTIDTISDFNIGQGDALDLSDILDTDFYLAGVSDITEFVTISTSGISSLVSVDIDGVGTEFAFVQIAVLSGVIGLTNEQLLLDNGNIIDV